MSNTQRSNFDWGPETLFFTLGKWQIIELLAMFYFYFYFFKDRKGANDLWMIVSQSLTFSVHFVIAFHIPRALVFVKHMYLYITLLLGYEFLFFISLIVHFFRNPCDLQKHISRAGYCIFIFCTRSRFPSREKKVFRTASCIPMKDHCCRNSTVIEW
jgi:hypothetical protein